MLRLPALLCVVLAAVVLGACGSAEREEGEQSPIPPTVQTPTTATGGAEELADRITDNLEDIPEIPGSTGPPPEEVLVRDIVEGNGRPAKRGDTVTVNYVGALYETGVQFDSSFERGEPFSVELGAEQVVPGFEEGLIGLRKGGRRLIVIPPEQAYGAAGAPPDIPPNATLAFVVDGEDVTSG